MCIRDRYSTGALQIEHGDQNEGVELLKQALEVDPSYQEPLLMLADLFRKEEEYEAIIELVQFVNEEDMDPQFVWQLAYAFGEEERDKEAQHFYELAFDTYKENIDFLKDYYYYLIEVGQTDQAKGILETLIEKDKGNATWIEEQERLM